MNELISKAKEMLEYSYSPYSNFKVGSALLTKNNSIYTGCNIESVSYTPTCCAERTAILKAVSEGNKEFKEIAIVGGLNGNISNYCLPCGVCLQMLSEFCEDTFLIHVTDGSTIKTYKLNELLPFSFRIEE